MYCIIVWLDFYVERVNRMNDLYLLRLEIAGIKNIQKPIGISFYKKTIKDDFNPEDYRIKAIYGENGSGKTAVMMAVRFLTKILLDKTYLSDSVNQRLFVENINKKNRSGHIEVEYYSKDAMGAFIYRYRVDFEIREDDRAYIRAERLDRKSGRYTQNQYIPVFETVNGALVYFEVSNLYPFCRERTQNLLEQRSFATFTGDIGENNGRDSLSYIHLLNLVLFAANVYVHIDGEDDHRDYVYKHLPAAVKESVLKESENLIVYSWASTAGNETKDLFVPKMFFESYQKQIARLTAFIQLFKTDLVNIEIEKKDIGDDLYKCALVMVYDGYRLDAEYESRGIRKLMTLFEVLDAACRGTIVFIDELDSNINDIYLNKLLEFFLYYGKGQLCFTAHNLSPMAVQRKKKNSISFLSGINTVHTWPNNGNQNPENAYRDGFIEDSPFNVGASDFLGILGGEDE